MSRNLYKLIQELESRVDDLERDNRLLQNEVNHLGTLLRLKDKIPERPFYPQPTSPWYGNEPTLKPPYKITCESKIKDKENEEYLKRKYDKLEEDPIVQFFDTLFE